MRSVRSRLLQLAILVAIIAIAPLLVPSNYYLRVMTLIYVFGLAAVGLNLLMGFAGQVSLGHAGFVGIGAYSVALGSVHWGLPGLYSVVLGAFVSAAIAALVGRPILRLKGHYLAVATLGFGFLIALLITNEAGLTGGPDGISVPRPVVFGWRLRTVEQWYWISGVALVVGVFIAQNLVASSTGRALRAIHDSEVAAQAIGVDVAKQKLKVFVVSAVYASLAGSLLAFCNGHITPDSTAGFLRSVELVTMVVLGGLGSVLGSVLGAAVLVLLPQVLTVFHDYEHLMLGLLMVLCIVMLPIGVVPSLAKKFARSGA
ncbi:branched-chain amino acid transport system permease protein [Nitrobacteraceae bacterium AZCC 1564]